MPSIPGSLVGRKVWVAGGCKRRFVDGEVGCGSVEGGAEELPEFKLQGALGRSFHDFPWGSPTPLHGGTSGRLRKPAWQRRAASQPFQRTLEYSAACLRQIRALDLLLRLLVSFLRRSQRFAMWSGMKRRDASGEPEHRSLQGIKAVLRSRCF